VLGPIEEVRVELDHVALALADRGPFWPLFARDLAGRWVGGGETLGGFAFSQLRFGTGMKVEALEPFSTERNDFLARFLAGAGPGPHHLTFMVDDVEEMLGRARSAGYRPVGVQLEGRHWKEAFLHPREAGGTLVQLAWSDRVPEAPVPPWLPEGRVAAPADLVHVAHAVADLDGALRLFKGLLDGRSADAGAGGGLGWVDLAWSRGGRLRLMAGPPVTPWLGGRRGRLHHLAFRVEDPGGVADAVVRDGWWEVPPAPPLGTRLVLFAGDDPVPVAL
jgi:methylmalonyl-CoA/ethylmalonyl-CoA epimerase